MLLELSSTHQGYILFRAGLLQIYRPTTWRNNWRRKNGKMESLIFLSAVFLSPIFLSPLFLSARFQNPCPTPPGALRNGSETFKMRQNFINETHQHINDSIWTTDL